MVTAPVTYTISHISPTIKFIPGTTMPTDGFDINWTTNTGLSGAVFLAKAQIGDADAIRAAVEEQASQLVSIHRMSGELT